MKVYMGHEGIFPRLGNVWRRFENFVTREFKTFLMKNFGKAFCAIVLRPRSWAKRGLIILSNITMAVPGTA
jgi:hypothetical protein